MIRRPRLALPSAVWHTRSTAPGADACMAFDVAGPSLLWLVRQTQHKGLHPEDVRLLARDILQGLHLLHAGARIIHTDLKLENVLLSCPLPALSTPAATAAEPHAGPLLAGPHAEPPLPPTTPSHLLQAALAVSCDAAPSTGAAAAVAPVSLRRVEAADQAISTAAAPLHIPCAVPEAVWAPLLPPGVGGGAHCRAWDVVVDGVAVGTLQHAAGPTQPGSLGAADTAAGAAEEQSPVQTAPFLLTLRADAALQGLQSLEAAVAGLAFLPAVRGAWCEGGVWQPCVGVGLTGRIVDSAGFLSSVAGVLPHLQRVPLLDGGCHATLSPAVPSLGLRSVAQRLACAQDPLNADVVACGGGLQEWFSSWCGGTRPSACIIDLGNACEVDRPFSDDIQTRQYRCPETVLRAPYDTSADMWSLGCLLFELLTGDFLFDPQPGEGHGRDEDHLAQMMELLGPLPKALLSAGKDTRVYFTPTRKLRHIHDLRYWGLPDVLREKYGWAPAAADAVADFLISMLHLRPSLRCSAREALDHVWLREDLTHEQAVLAFHAAAGDGAGSEPALAAAAAMPPPPPPEAGGAALPMESAPGAPVPEAGGD